MNSKWTILSLSALMGAFILGGCTQEAQEKYDKAGEAAGNSAEMAGNAAATDAKVTGEVIKDAGQEAQEKSDAALMTGKVRNSIATANDISIEDLNVDTNAETKTIVLKGNARDQASKTGAQKAAESQAGNDYKIDNQLTVGGK